MRYCARPPLALARLTELPHGKLGYRIKKLRNHRNKLRIMTYDDLIERTRASLEKILGTMSMGVIGQNVTVAIFQ